MPALLMGARPVVVRTTAPPLAAAARAAVVRAAVERAALTGDAFVRAVADRAVADRVVAGAGPARPVDRTPARCRLPPLTAGEATRPVRGPPGRGAPPPRPFTARVTGGAANRWRT